MSTYRCLKVCVHISDSLRCVCGLHVIYVRQKSQHVDLMPCNVSLSDVSHRCVAVTWGGVKSNI